MHIDVLTLFPEMVQAVNSSMIRKAADRGILEFNWVNIRDFSNDKHNKTDEPPFGGGPGMVLMADPVFGAMESVQAQDKRVLYMSPRGRLIDRDLLSELACEESLVILCGHYEGVDQRALDYWNAEELSIGDYILTGGELPAMVLIDAMARLIPGVLSSEESAMSESVYSGLLEQPQYTRPRSYRGMDVPEVLLSGNHRQIHLWQFEQSLIWTARLRPDLFEKYLQNHGDLDKQEQNIVEKVRGML